MNDLHPKSYSRYVVRDTDGEVVQQGRVYPLRRAIALELLGKDKSTVRVDTGFLGQVLGPYVFWPDVKAGPFLRVEVF